MNANAISFFNTFITYLLVYVVFGACIVGAVFAGIAARKRKNLKEAQATEEISADDDATEQTA